MISTTWDSRYPDYYPGGIKAHFLNCSCPSELNRWGKGVEGEYRWIIGENCPIHNKKYSISEDGYKKDVVSTIFKEEFIKKWEQ